MMHWDVWWLLILGMHLVWEICDRQQCELTLSAMCFTEILIIVDIVSVKVTFMYFDIIFVNYFRKNRTLMKRRMLTCLFILPTRNNSSLDQQTVCFSESSRDVCDEASS